MNAYPALPQDIEQAMTVIGKMTRPDLVPFMRHFSPDKAKASLMEAARRNRAYMVDGYLVVFDLMSPWHSDITILIEEFVLRVYPTSQPPSVIPEFLEAARALHNAAYIVSGDGQVGAMSKHYLAAGYRKIGEQYMKE
jgi:hypothetical protein